MAETIYAVKTVQFLKYTLKSAEKFEHDVTRGIPRVCVRVQVVSVSVLSR